MPPKIQPKLDELMLERAIDVDIDNVEHPEVDAARDGMESL